MPLSRCRRRARCRPERRRGHSRHHRRCCRSHCYRDVSQMNGPPSHGRASKILPAVAAAGARVLGASSAVREIHPRRGRIGGAAAALQLPVVVGEVAVVALGAGAPLHEERAHLRLRPGLRGPGVGEGHLGLGGQDGPRHGPALQRGQRAALQLLREVGVVAVRALGAGSLLDEEAAHLRLVHDGGALEGLRRLRRHRQRQGSAAAARQHGLLRRQVRILHLLREVREVARRALGAGSALDEEAAHLGLQQPPGSSHGGNHAVGGQYRRRGRRGARHGAAGVDDGREGVAPELLGEVGEVARRTLDARALLHEERAHLRLQQPRAVEAVRRALPGGGDLQWAVQVAGHPGGLQGWVRLQLALVVGEVAELPLGACAPLDEEAA
mmetsp:Transcript_54086/g.152393  ORF Transcript_54086/g.152393 Transcript_54086/m.152393 type:complete len:383 (+) Transcript_54086:48-1196(+)